MKAALYARVSTTQEWSVDIQLRDLRELALRRGLQIVEKWCDEGVSGAENSRPALIGMHAHAHTDKFSGVRVGSSNRLGQSLVPLVTLMEDFRRLGIELVSFFEGLDFTATTDRLLFQIISAFAEFERNCIRERVRAGMRTVKTKGNCTGRPPGNYLGQEAHTAIAKAYRRREGSLRQREPSTARL